MTAVAPAPDAWWSHWLGDPLAALALLLLGAGYAVGVRRLWARHGRGAVVARWQARLFALGAAVLAIALLSPLEAAAHALLWVHMVQHLLLVLVAAPLLVLGGPLAPLLAVLDEPTRRRAHRLRASAPVRRAAHGVGGVVAACTAHVAVMWLWHVPALYEAAVRWTVVHALEHTAMLGSAMWVWGTIVQRGGPIRRARPAGALAMFLTGTLTVGLGPLMTFSPAPWYDVYAATAPAWGVAALADQQLAGGIMWGIGGLFYPAAGAVLFALWLSADAAGDRSGPTSPWWKEPR